MRSKNNKLINLYHKDTAALINSGSTSADDLYELAKRIGINRLLEQKNIQPLKVAWLNQFDKSYKGPQILNLGSNVGYGTHWVSVFNGIYFDPLSLPPPNELSYLNWSPLAVQSRMEEHCGQWNLLFIYHSLIDEIDRFYSTFRAIAPSSLG